MRNKTYGLPLLAACFFLTTAQTRAGNEEVEKAKIVFDKILEGMNAVKDHLRTVKDDKTFSAAVPNLDLEIEELRKLYGDAKGIDRSKITAPADKRDFDTAYDTYKRRLKDRIKDVTRQAVRISKLDEKTLSRRNQDELRDIIRSLNVRPRR